MDHNITSSKDRELTKGNKRLTRTGGMVGRYRSIGNRAMSFINCSTLFYGNHPKPSLFGILQLLYRTLTASIKTTCCIQRQLFISPLRDLFMLSFIMWPQRVSWDKIFLAGIFSPFFVDANLPFLCKSSPFFVNPLPFWQILCSSVGNVLNWEASSLFDPAINTDCGF